MSSANRVTYSHTKFDDANLPQRLLNYQWECVGNETQLLSCLVSTSTFKCNNFNLGGVYCFGKISHLVRNIETLSILVVLSL